MSSAWQLFANSLSIATQNYWSFVKIWFTSCLIIIVIGMLFGASNMESFILMFTTDPEAMSPEQVQQVMGTVQSMSIFIFLFALIAIFVGSGLSVNSYRFFLGDFKPSWVPFQFDWSTTFAFMGWSIVLGLIATAVILIPALIGGWFAGMAYQSGSGFMMFLSWLVLVVGMAIAYVIIFRLLNKIIGRTIGDTISFGEAWNKTKGTFGFYLAITIFIMIVGWLINLLFTFVFGLFFGIFQNSPTMLSIISFFVFVGVLMLVIFQYALMFAIFSQIYNRFFQGGDTTKIQA